MDELEAVDLPSREWIVLDLEAVIDAKDAQSLATCERGCGATTPTAGCSASGCPPRGRSGSGASFGPYSPNVGE